MRLAVAGLVALVLAGWVACDAARRNRNWFGWSSLVVFTGVLGVIPWLVIRRRAPVTVERLGFRRASLLSIAGLPLALFVLMTFTFVVTFVFQVSHIEGQAMAPTLKDQERVIINKLAYRTSPPRRGEIVTFYYPVQPEKMFVKRLIAEEGDEVRIADGRVYVNDVALDEDGYVPAEFRSHDDFGPTRIPEGYYFVLGDHRNNSSDSRHWGLVPKRYILGRIVQFGG
jgi:signal peptidase I